MRWLIRWLALKLRWPRRCSWTSTRPNVGRNLQALLALALLIQSEATPPSPAQLEERLRDTELGERLRPCWSSLLQGRRPGRCLAARGQRRFTTAGGQYPSRQLERLTEKNVIRA